MVKLRLWLVVIVALAGCGGGGGSTQRKTKPPAPPPRIAAKVKTFKLGGEMWAVLATKNVVWAIGREQSIDLKKRRETARIHLGTSYPFAVAFLHGNVWVLDYYANTLTRVDPRANRVTGRLQVGPPRNRDNIAPNVPAELSSYGRNLWVTDADRGTLTRVELP